MSMRSVCLISDEITASFRRFGHLFVDWPHKAESKSYFPPKGASNCHHGFFILCCIVIVCYFFCFFYIYHYQFLIQLINTK